MECFENEKSRCLVGYEGITIIPDVSKDDRWVKEMSIDTTGVIGYELIHDSIILIYQDRIHWINHTSDIIIKTSKVDQLCINKDHTAIYVRNADLHFMYTRDHRNEPSCYFGGEGHSLANITSNEIHLVSDKGMLMSLSNKGCKEVNIKSSDSKYIELISRDKI